MTTPQLKGTEHMGGIDDPELRPLYEVKADLFRGLAHPLRIRVLEVLSAAPEVSVGTLQEATGLEQSHLSQHLSVLRRHRLVRSERRGSQVFYRLTYPQVADLLRVARELLGIIVMSNHESLRAVELLPAVGLPADTSEAVASDPADPVTPDPVTADPAGSPDAGTAADDGTVA